MRKSTGSRTLETVRDSVNDSVMESDSVAAEVLDSVGDSEAVSVSGRVRDSVGDCDSVGDDDSVWLCVGSRDCDCESECVKMDFVGIRVPDGVSVAT